MEFYPKKVGLEAIGVVAISVSNAPNEDDLGMPGGRKSGDGSLQQGLKIDGRIMCWAMAGPALWAVVDFLISGWHKHIQNLLQNRYDKAVTPACKSPFSGHPFLVTFIQMRLQDRFSWLQGLREETANWVCNTSNLYPAH